MTEIRIAVAQGVATMQLPTETSVRAQARRVRELMTKAAEGGARLVLFTEAALSGYPHKLRISSDPDQLAEADWSKADWAVLDEELAATVAHAGEVGVWAAVGSVHRDAERERPYNSMYVISDTGQLVGRYDKRYLSPTESTYMFAAGDHPTVFEIDGFRFGCALCIEANLPDVFIEYESLGVDCVLLASYNDGPAGGGGIFNPGEPGGPVGDSRSMAYAMLTGMWIAFAAPGVEAGTAVSCVASPDDRWLVTGQPDGMPQVSFADLNPSDLDTRPGYDGGFRLWRAWQRNGHPPTRAEVTAWLDSPEPNLGARYAKLYSAAMGHGSAGPFGAGAGAP